MYDRDYIISLHLKSEDYFRFSFGYTFNKLTKEELQNIRKCLDDLHQVRLICDSKYKQYYENN